ncbi:hypothetical protein BC628DRAFT_324335 [Trametes gibbosa]|nr:hypothetical protein BC628DRAFT_324335 [Trametes gibbosa]
MTNILSMILEELSYTVWLSFSVLRVYALSGRSWRAALVVTVPGVVPLASNFYLYAKTISENYPYPIGCLWTPMMPPHTYNIVLLAMNILHIALTLTLRFTWIIALEEPLTTILHKLPLIHSTSG